MPSYGWQHIFPCVLLEGRFFSILEVNKLLNQFIFGICLISWPLFFVLSAIYFFPLQTFRVFDNSFSSSYSFDYSEIINDGSILNPIFTFTNIDVSNPAGKVFTAKKSSLGILLSPRLLLGEVRINLVLIESGLLMQPQPILNTTSSLDLMLDSKIFLLLQDFSFINQESSININGEINGLLFGSMNGQLTFFHQGNLSTFSINSDGESSNFLLNLHAYEWLQLIPHQIFWPMRDLNFGINAFGSMHANQSSFQGSLHYEDTNFESFLLKKNHGSFLFESQGKAAAIIFKKFLHPFVDAQFPIQFNLSSKSIIIPKLFASDQLIQFRKSQINNISIENLNISITDEELDYSGRIIDLDLKEVYFNEILNIQGGFSGNNKNLKFSIASSNSLIQSHAGKYHPIEIIGSGGFSEEGMNLVGDIKLLTGDITLDLDIDSSAANPISLQLTGHDLSKEIILASIPKSLPIAHEFINLNIESSNQNELFLSYLSSGQDLDSQLILKLALNDSKLRLKSGVRFQFNRGLIEVNKDNLYIHTPSGNINDVSINSFDGIFNFSKKVFKYSSSHDITHSEFLALIDVSAPILTGLSIQAISKGNINFFSNDLFNATSLITNQFSFPPFNKFNLDLKQGQIFIVNLDSIFGIFPAKFFDENLEIILQGTNLLKRYDFTFTSKVQLRPSDFISETNLLKLLGQDRFLVNLSLGKTKKPRLSLFSELRGIEFVSSLKFLNKPRLVSLPTTIEISDLTKPSLHVKNQLLELEIKDLNSFDGYLSVGEQLPKKFSYLKQSDGFNLYLGTASLSTPELEALMYSKIVKSKFNLNKLIFNVKKLEIYKNNFLNISGLIDFNGSEVNGKITGSNLNGTLRKDSSNFIRLELYDSHIHDISFLSLNNNANNANNASNLNSRLIVKNSSINDLKIKSLDLYVLKNKNLLTFNNINLNSNLVSIAPISDSANAYFSIDSSKLLYKLRGDFMIKDSLKVPLINDFANFSYFNGAINLQWKNMKMLRHIEGDINFILKDIAIKNRSKNAVALNLLGLFNLKNILGKVANLDLSIDEFTSTKLSRVEGSLLFNQSKARLLSPLFVETNAAKMKWVGQINKNRKGELDQLDLSLDLRVRVGENIPWYAAILGGLPAVAGSALIGEIFEDDINKLSNYQYEVGGRLAQPEIKRVN